MSAESVQWWRSRVRLESSPSYLYPAQGEELDATRSNAAEDTAHLCSARLAFDAHARLSAGQDRSGLKPSLVRGQGVSTESTHCGSELHCSADGHLRRLPSVLDGNMSSLGHSSTQVSIFSGVNLPKAGLEPAWGQTRTPVDMSPCFSLSTCSSKRDYRTGEILLDPVLVHIARLMPGIALRAIVDGTASVFNARKDQRGIVV